MDRRKSLTEQYKQEEPVGGVYRITNTVNGKYLLDYSPNLKGKENAFRFMSSHGSCVDYRLAEDWALHGAEAFVFEELEALKKKKEQSRDEFADDLKMLVKLWAEKLGPSTRY
jgi:hypothetical protein